MRITYPTRLAPLLLAATTAILSVSHAQTSSKDGWLNLTVIHTNDIHARVDPANYDGFNCSDDDKKKGTCYGGAARHKTLIQDLRKGKTSLLLDGGDEFQGTLWYNFYKGDVASQIMNALGYDLTTVGNHEWDNGVATLAKFWKQLNMPIVCANCVLSGETLLKDLVKPYHIFEDLGIAIIGYITPTTAATSNAGPTVSFTDPIPAVQKCVDELEAKGIKRILALSHHGYENDKVVAAQTRGIDLIVGAHSHTLLGDEKNPLSKGPYPTVVKNQGGEDTLIAFYMGRYVGNLDVVFDPKGKIVEYQGAPILVDQSIKPDPELQKQVDTWRQKFEAWSTNVLGKATADFDFTRCKNDECSTGNLIADTMLERAKNASSANGPFPDLAIIQSRVIRAAIPQGLVTAEKVLTTIPYDNVIVQMPMTGQALLQTLEAVVIRQHKDTHKNVTSPIQISGMRFTYDSSLPLMENHIKNATIKDRQGKWVAINPQRTYQVVTSYFLWNGGDNIFGKLDSALVNLGDLGKAVMDHIASVKTITPYTDGRIFDDNVTRKFKRGYRADRA
ncbi:hypothetical protein KVV02_004109 [Mortierella alpina]|uniref:5'-nucleotidase n=1 Tax=Mortierella alpina TaxID=64518 RepID=A0A9P7ZY48_MORAP|nr:hypothetical protein KVV02_004109 [Mortierella alpina]